MRWTAHGGALLAALSFASMAVAQPPPSVPDASRRPLLEGDTWIRLGGGYQTAGQPPALFELGGGSEVTLPLTRDGDIRVGAFMETATSNFDFGYVGSGPVFQFTAMPSDLDMFQWVGDGVLSLRLLGGIARGVEPAVPPGTLVVGGTVTWGYRAPFDLQRDYTCASGQDRATPCPAFRYFTGMRFFVSTQYALAGEAHWQVTSGIEFELVGSIRYLFALY